MYPGKQDELENLLSFFGIDENLDDEESMRVLASKLDMKQINGMALALNMETNQFMQIYNVMPKEVKANLEHTLKLIQMAEYEPVLYSMPNIPHIK
ncbi:MAG: hypothetical protein B7C24_17550 [Bacteroidetes bacterium 4572_77]|nr:MAG: hypothetical protein B7C24_17550 [Bacteroidetes bacterium 4572_77]